METEVLLGEYWEGMPWKLIIPYEGESGGYSPLCKHAVLRGENVPQFRSDGTTWGHKQKFVLPDGIAECRNEAGFNGTGLCLACLDEARAEVKTP